ncbi:GGDEF domain-containing protein [Marinimicrobium alkaliphilum]|uniref:GGDEF domain-containing protein n=1 Tax=Marinimicrobium alkaliphilum TaxID=2202654 RepID=UPI000DB98A25|nr:GGDEF domain-containing protein [Marinimicrobium alkaliphilum]
MHSPEEFAPALNCTTSAEAAYHQNRLYRALATSLEPERLIALFFKHLQPMIQVDGVSFCATDSVLVDTRVGEAARHHCEYRLSLDGSGRPPEHLGLLKFYRKRRFSEAETQTLEGLLSTLVFPLRNALTHQKTLIMALVDPLTQVGNRHALDAALTREICLAERQGQPLALLVLDIDHFKTINDTHGHSLGDRALALIADKLKELCRACDQVFRYGGEEFVVILSNTGSEGAGVIAERLRSAIETEALQIEAQALNMTVSIGISAYNGRCGERPARLFERADDALYQAKAQGRNRIVTEPARSDRRQVG